MQPEDLNRFLDQAVREGQLEGQGRFSIDPSKALTKSAFASFQRSTSWLSRIFQALTVAKAEKLALVAGRSEIEFLVEGPMQWDSESLEAAFTDFEETRIESLTLLRLAIWYLLYVCDKSVTITPCNCDITLVGSKAGWTRQTCSVQDSTTIRIEVGKRTLDGDGFSASDIEAELRLVGAAFPYSVVFIQNSFPQKMVSCLFRPIIRLGTGESWPIATLLEANGPQHFRVPMSVASATASTIGPANLHQKIPPLASEAAGAITLGIHVADPNGRLWPEISTLFWIHHGVVIEEVPLPATESKVWAQIYLCADGLKFDVGGQLAKDEQFCHRVERLCGLLLPRLHELPVHTASFDANIESMRRFEMFIGAPFCAGLGAMLGLVLPGGWFLGAVMGAGLCVSMSTSKSVLAEEIRSGSQTLCQQLPLALGALLSSSQPG